MAIRAVYNFFTCSCCEQNDPPAAIRPESTSSSEEALPTIEGASAPPPLSGSKEGDSPEESWYYSVRGDQSQGIDSTPPFPSLRTSGTRSQPLASDTVESEAVMRNLETFTRPQLRLSDTLLRSIPEKFYEDEIDEYLEKIAHLLRHIYSAQRELRSQDPSLQEDPEIASLAAECANYEKALSFLHASVSTMKKCFSSKNAPVLPEYIHFHPLYRQMLLLIAEGNPLIRGEMVGIGSYGMVYPTRIRDIQIVEKEIEPAGPEQIERIARKAIREIAILFSLPRVEHLCLPVTAIQTEHKTTISFEKAEHDLYSLLAQERGKDSDRMFISYLPQILRGLHTLHSTRYKGKDGDEGIGIIHGDLKPENILYFSDGKVQLADFGLSGLTGEPVRGYSLLYTAPEIMKKRAVLQTANDIWAFGIICAIILFEDVPFSKERVGSPWFHDQTNIDARLHTCFMNDKVQEKVRRFDPDTSLYSMIKACLKVDPKERPTAAQLLKSPLFGTAHIVEEDDPTLGGAAGGGGALATSSMPSPRELYSQTTTRTPKKEAPPTSWEEDWEYAGAYLGMSAATAKREFHKAGLTPHNKV